MRKTIYRRTEGRDAVEGRPDSCLGGDEKVRGAASKLCTSGARRAGSRAALPKARMSLCYRLLGIMTASEFEGVTRYCECTRLE